MKIFKFMVVALVAMLGFSSCSEDCDHNFIEYDYTQDLVGTWTCMEADYAEALVIKADGSLEVTGVVDGAYFESKGTIKVVNNKMIYNLDNGDEFEGRFEMVAGESFSMVWDDELDIRYTYHYCENDLADEIVGMWVSNDGVKENMGMTIQTFTKDGKAFFTGEAQFTGPTLNIEVAYKVVGDLMFQRMLDEDREVLQNSFATRLTYTSNGTSLGDIMTHITNLVEDNLEVVEYKSSWLRVKEGLNLTGKVYDYSSAYVTNAKGIDEDFSIMGNIFNIANINAGDFDIILGSTLFCVELNANSIKHKYILNGQDKVFDAPITVDGNKVTLDMSAVNPALRKVEMYMFQDADDSQLHMYMHTDAFINYFANLEVVTMLQAGKINQSDAAAVEKVFTDMEARVESINVSFVLKARK